MTRSRSTEPEPLAAVLHRAFAEWAGPCCSSCGLPALLHTERCELEELQAGALQRDLPTGTRSPAGGARHAPRLPPSKEAC